MSLSIEKNVAALKVQSEELARSIAINHYYNQIVTAEFYKNLNDDLNPQIKVERLCKQIRDAVSKHDIECTSNDVMMSWLLKEARVITSIQNNNS